MPNSLSWSTLAHRDILNFWVLWTLAMDRGGERVNWDVIFIPAWDFLLLTITFKKVNLTKSSLDFKFALVVSAWFWQVGLFEMFHRGEENSIHSLLCDVVSCSIETGPSREVFLFCVSQSFHIRYGISAWCGVERKLKRPRKSTNEKGAM